MITTKTLIDVTEAFMAADSGLRESTLSYRMFGDSKKLAALRSGAEITLGRFNAAARWLAANWPVPGDVPEGLQSYLDDSTPQENAA